MRVALRAIEPTSFGSGWFSGVLSAALGLIGLGAVLCFHFPELLTTPEARAFYPLPYARALLHVVLVAAFVMGAISLSLRRNKGKRAAVVKELQIAKSTVMKRIGQWGLQDEGRPGGAADADDEE